MAEKALDIKLGVKGEAEAMGAFKRVQNSIEASYGRGQGMGGGASPLRRSLENEGEEAGKAGGRAAASGFFASLKEGAGRGSTFGLLAQSLRGGGPLLAFGLISRELSRGSQEMARLNKELRDGTIGAEEFRMKLAESLPILGGFVSAGRAIREAFTGEQAAIDATLEAAKRQDELHKQGKVDLNSGREAKEKTEDLARERAQKAERERALSTDDAKEIATRQEYKNKKISIERDLAAGLRKTADEYEPLLEKAREARNKASFAEGEARRQTALEVFSAGIYGDTDALKARRDARGNEAHKAVQAAQDEIKQLEARRKHAEDVLQGEAGKQQGINASSSRDDLVKQSDDRHRHQSQSMRQLEEDAVTGAEAVGRRFYKAEEERFGGQKKSEQELTDFKIQMLEERGQAGDKLAEREAKRLKILDEEKKKREELNHIIFGVTSTTAERQAALAAGKQLEFQTSERVRLLGQGERMSDRLAGGDAGRFTVGAAERSREAGGPQAQIAENTKQSADAAQKLVDAAKGMQAFIAAATAFFKSPSTVQVK